MKWIVARNGITRTVLLTRRYAIKIPGLRGGRGPRGVAWMFTRGWQANLSEIEWSGSPGTCPVIWHGLAGLIAVYPYCPAVPDPETIDYDAIGFLGPADRKPDNVGVYRGQVVYVDYDMSWNDCRRACAPTGAQPRK